MIAPSPANRNEKRPYLPDHSRNGTWAYPVLHVSADGEQFVMIRPDRDAEPKKIQIVLNWFDELERLVP